MTFRTLVRKPLAIFPKRGTKNTGCTPKILSQVNSPSSPSRSLAGQRSASVRRASGSEVEPARARRTPACRCRGRSRAGLYRSILITLCQTAPLQIRDKTTQRYVFPPRRGFTGPSLRPREKAKIHSHFGQGCSANGPHGATAAGENDRRGERGGCRRGAARVYL